MLNSEDAICPSLNTFPVLFIWKNVVKIEYQQVVKFELAKYLQRNYLHSIKTVFQETNRKIVFAKNEFDDQKSFQNTVLIKIKHISLLLNCSVFNMAISMHFLSY